MPHEHNINDADSRFIVDPVTRSIKNTSEKTMIMQYDHKSECITFEIPRYIEGNDMSLCNHVQIHYLNTGKDEEYKGVYIVDDLHIDETDDSKVVCSWTITSQSTKCEGVLNFIIRFMRSEDDITYYAWNTGINHSIRISKGIYNADSFDDIADEYADIISEWENRITSMESIVSGISGVDKDYVDDADTNLQNQIDELIATSYNKEQSEEKFVAKESGKGLSTNDFTNEYKSQLDNLDIPTALADLTEDPTHRTVTDAEKSSWNDKLFCFDSTDDLVQLPATSRPFIWGTVETEFEYADITSGATMTIDFIEDGLYWGRHNGGRYTFTFIANIDNMQSIDDKVTSISASSTNNEYPSAKATYDLVQSVKGTSNTYTIAPSSWSALTDSDPFDYSATVTLIPTLGANSTVELINDNSILFANYGFSILSVSGQTATIASIGQPDDSVMLKVVVTNG